MYSGVPNPKEVGRYLALAQVGLEMVSPIGLGLALDYSFGWLPWGTIVGAVFGLIAGIGHLFMLANRQARSRHLGPPGDVRE
jgi:F0F1-type ATP synthase assembly protein I